MNSKIQEIERIASETTNNIEDYLDTMWFLLQSTADVCTDENEKNELLIHVDRVKAEKVIYFERLDMLGLKKIA